MQILVYNAIHHLQQLLIYVTAASIWIAFLCHQLLVILFVISPVLYLRSFIFCYLFPLFLSCLIFLTKSQFRLLECAPIQILLPFIRVLGLFVFFYSSVSKYRNFCFSIFLNSFLYYYVIVTAGDDNYEFFARPSAISVLNSYL